MFQNVLMAVTPLSEIKDEIDCWENRPFIHSWPESKQQKRVNKDTVSRTIKKKNKRNRTAYTTDQLRILEKTYARTKYVDAERRKELADNLQISEKCVKVWFQNRRMKEKKECSESSNDSSSECISYENISPPPTNLAHCKTDEQNVQLNNTCMEQTVHSSNHMEPQSNFYNYEENCKAFHPIYTGNYQNYVPYDYASYNIPSHTDGYSCNDATVYPAQYYPCSAIPEYYTNLNNDQFVQNQQNNFFPTISSESHNWSGLNDY